MSEPCKVCGRDSFSGLCDTHATKVSAVALAGLETVYPDEVSLAVHAAIATVRAQYEAVYGKDQASGLRELARKADTN